MSVKTVSSQADAANPLGYEKEGKLLVGFAIPCIISMLVTALYNIVDQIFIGTCGYVRPGTVRLPTPNSCRWSKISIVVKKEESICAKDFLIGWKRAK